LEEDELNKRGYEIDKTINIGIIFTYRKAHPRGEGKPKDKVRRVVK